MDRALTNRYDAAAPAWADKMRTLGYYDGYVSFLQATCLPAEAGTCVIDIGAGTAAFAEAFTAIHGPDHRLTLLEPSAAMASRGAVRLAARGVETEIVIQSLEDFDPGPRFDCLLAAHVIEHGDGAEMLSALRRLARPGARLWLVVSKPHWCNAIIWLQWRHKTYAPDVLTAMLQRAGWAVEKTHTFASGPPSRTSHGYLCRAV